jgi:hypothetical protein
MWRTEEIHTADIPMLLVMPLRFCACADRPSRTTSIGGVRRMCSTTRGFPLPGACSSTPIGDAGGAHVPDCVREDAWTAPSRRIFPASTSWSYTKGHRLLAPRDPRPQAHPAIKHREQRDLPRQGVRASRSVTASHVSHVPASETMTNNSPVRGSATE